MWSITFSEVPVGSLTLPGPYNIFSNLNVLIQRAEKFLSIGDVKAFLYQTARTLLLWLKVKLQWCSQTRNCIRFATRILRSFKSPAMVVAARLKNCATVIKLVSWLHRKTTKVQRWHLVLWSAIWYWLIPRLDELRKYAE